MEIAVIGSGSIGGTLARKWAAAGHRVMIGSRSPSALQAEAEAMGASASTVAAALDAARVVLLAIPGKAVEELVREHRARLSGRLLIDATNRVGAPTMNSVETLAESGAPIYRAFNSLGWENFERPQFGGERADLFFAGPDGEGRQTVSTLIADVGLRPVWLGGPEAIPLVDAMTRVWFALAQGRRLGRHLAFRVLSDGPV